MKDIKTLCEKIEIIPRKKLIDSRGWFLKTITGFEKSLSKSNFEIYTVFSENGNSRGGHYHKKASEWFILISGKATLVLKDIYSDESKTIEMDSDKPVTVVIPPFIAHRFDSRENKPFLLLAYTNLVYDPLDTVTCKF